MAIDFPASPGVNDTHTVGTTTFVWNGTYWGRSANTAKFTAADAAPSSPALGDLWYESDSGKAFIYYDNSWVELGHASDGQTFQTSDTMPTSATAGDIWYETDTGKTFIYYTDANTSQWVEIGHASEGQTFAAQDAPPSAATASNGDIWFETDTGATFVLFVDANSRQWVELGHTSNVDFGTYNIDGGLSNSTYGSLTAIDSGCSA